MALRTPLTAQPHLYIGDSTGRPLDYGRVYFGEPNKDPEFYPIDIYLDPEMTIAAAQPVRTKGGFMDVGGNLAELHAAEFIYSLKVLDQYGRQVFYKPEMYRNNVSDFLVDEITRATAAETLIAGNLTAETQRAVAAEKVIADAVVAEKDRAIAAEDALDIKHEALSSTINSLGGGKKAYTTYALMVADKNNIAANSSIDVTNDTDPLKNGTYSYDGAVFTKSMYDVESIVRTKVLNTFKTKSLMDASALPDGADAQVTDDTVNHGLYVKTAGAWVKSAYDPAASTKALVESNNMFSPKLLSTSTALSSLEYGVVYISNPVFATTANGFPIDGKPTLVFTAKINGTSNKYQKAILILETPVRTFERRLTTTETVWTELPTMADATSKNKTVDKLETDVSYLKTKILTVGGKNKLNPRDIVAGERFFTGANKIEASPLFRRSGFMPVKEGLTYTISGNAPSTASVAWYATNDKNSTAISYYNSAKATAPMGAKYAVINITSEGADNTSYDNVIQFEQSEVATPFEPYYDVIPKNIVDGVAISRADLLQSASYNKIDPSKIDFTRRYSAGSKTFVSDTVLVAATDWIPVDEGKWYTLSGAGAYGYLAATPQGGYFTKYGDFTALDNITFIDGVAGRERSFKVPTGLGITHVVVGVVKTADNQLAGEVQLEEGENETAYRPYNDTVKIKSAYLDDKSSTAIDDAAWYKYVSADTGKLYQDKLPKFRKSMLLKDSDVVVVNTGTSLTARTSEHSTLRRDAAYRPPMMHSNAFCSHIWDALKWEGQQYRRYDAASMFTETGAFLTRSNVAEWDDNVYRDGLTRYSADANAAVAFTVPVDAWQFNFIYRTDSKGCNAKVTIAEGVGNMQVYDDATSTWVEAHNYAFSQLEATPVARDIVLYDFITNAPVTRNIKSKGNTTYQKRLKMRCRDNTGTLDSMSSTKSVTISRTGGGERFMYWGVEYSPRQYMITYINAARGSHQTNATNSNGLPRFADNEIWSFKPTLILSELAIHNDGAAGAAISPVGQWQGLTYNYVNNTDYELSLFSRAAHFGNTDVEYAFFTASIAYNFGGINEDGSLKYSLQTASIKGDAKMMSALDKFQEATEYLNSQGIPCIDATKRWVEAGYAIYGDLKTATVGSGKAGNTLTHEGSHWNDTGSKIMAKAVIPII